MAMPATPSKRILTEEAHNALNVPRLPFGNVTPDDLTTRLQNLGSRVRKHVTEGYVTQRASVFPSATPTPFSSPVKQSTTTSSASRTSPIFRSSNDTLIDVFSSPERASVFVPSPSPSPKKRGRAEVDLPEGEEEDEYLPLGIRSKQGEDSVMELGVVAEDEDLPIIRNESPTRPIKPLKKVTRVQRPSVSPFELPSHTNRLCHDSSGAGTASPVAEIKGLLNQPF